MLADTGLTLSSDLMRHTLFILALVLLFSCNNGSDKTGSHHRVADKTSGTKLLIDRPTYAVERFSDWTIDSATTMKNVETHFTLHSPYESGLITFFLFDHPQDERESLKRHIMAQLNKSIPNGVVKYITNWGSYKGHGAIIKGKNTASMPSKLVIFVSSTDESSFIITSVYADEYEDQVLPGLNLIESSFKMKH